MKFVSLAGNQGRRAGVAQGGTDSGTIGASEAESEAEFEPSESKLARVVIIRLVLPGSSEFISAHSVTSNIG